MHTFQGICMYDVYNDLRELPPRSSDYSLTCFIYFLCVLVVALSYAYGKFNIYIYNDLLGYLYKREKFVCLININVSM